jgi:hypothetical protein
MPRFYLFLPFLLFVLTNNVASQTTPAPSSAYKISENCDLAAWNQFLISGRDGQPTNEELLQQYSLGCRLAIKRLTQGFFGPASHYSRFTVGCKGVCQQWDALQAQGRGNSRCTCQDLDSCDQNTYFWMCKTLYECRTAVDHRQDFCNGCGTGQRDEFDFYDELDCGHGHTIYFTKSSITMFVMLVLPTVLTFAWW